MVKENEIYCEYESDIDKDITYEVSDDIKITTKIIYRQKNVINYLINRVRMLEEKLERLDEESNKISITEESLNELWDNKEDDSWNDI